MTNESIVIKLFEIGALKFGTFTLKSGLISPFYIDLRVTISNPSLLAAIGEALYKSAAKSQYDLLCGVPYTALPFATAISLAHNIPMLLRRKEKKEYGTAKLLEGIFKHGQTCLIVEDVITSGRSILETAQTLLDERLHVKDAVVLVDREQGGKNHLAEKGIRLHSVCTITSMTEILTKAKKIDEKTSASTLQFVQENQV